MSCYLAGKRAAARLAAAPKLNLYPVDSSVDPCDDFYEYACGDWLRNNPRPPDKSAWGPFYQLGEENLIRVKGLLEELASKKQILAGNEKKLSDFYTSCLDEKAIEAEGLAPVRSELDRIEALKSKTNLPGVMARLHESDVPGLFAFGSDISLQDAKRTIAGADQPDLSLPDREYYIEDRHADIRKAFQAHVQKMFELAGEPAGEAAAEAATVLSLEMSMAKISMDSVKRRDPHNLDHKMTYQGWTALTPSFDWTAYLKAIKAPKFKELNVRNPDYFRALEPLLRQEPLQRWKAYLKWQTLNARASLLPSALVNEHFEFFGKTLSGVSQLEARFKRCTRMTDAALGDALGSIYVDRYFGKDGKARAMEMVLGQEKALAEIIAQSPWMSAETQKKAREKLDAIANKIGFPDKWIDFSQLQIKPADPLGNARRAASFAFRRSLDKIGKPTDRGEWPSEFHPQTVNAFYGPRQNSINFPAGILQPPFFDKNADMAANYGAMGAVIGHEMSHGFDDQGRSFDGDGNMRDWWTDKDAEAFKSRAQCMVNQYGNYTVIKNPADPSKDLKLNGELTLGENIADNGGMRIAYNALMSKLPNPAQTIHSFTPEQRFFLSWGQTWCINASEEKKRTQTASNEHAFAKFRANGVVTNMPEFQKAFSCKAGSAMAPQPAERCRVW